MTLSSQKTRDESVQPLFAKPRRRWRLWPVGVSCFILLATISFGALWWRLAPQTAHATSDSLTATTSDAAATPAPQTAPTPAPQTAPAQALGLPVTPLPATPATAAADLLAPGMRLLEEGHLVEGRRLLSQLLTHPGAGLSKSDAQTVRDTLASVNRELIFSKKIVEGDPLVERYIVQSGDLLSKIAPRYKVTWQFLETLNQVDARKIWVGQKLKMVKGPFSAVVKKSDYRMDLYLPGADGTPIYIRSFTVGLGEANSTPPGRFVIKTGGKVSNPAWVNPRTGESFAANDPKNPIGEYWLALQGLDPGTQNLSGYGIHGTTEPDSIGRQASMGCVRMSDPDIEHIYKLLVETHSHVTIEP